MHKDFVLVDISKFQLEIINKAGDNLTYQAKQLANVSRSEYKVLNDEMDKFTKKLGITPDKMELVFNIL